MAEHQAKILIVDDELSIRESLAEALEKSNYHIDLAASAEDAIVAISGSATPYNLVLSDLKMAGMSGDELLQWIKKKHPETEVVIITAYATIENAVQAIKDGAIDYINKPIDIFRFRKMVHTIIDRQRLLVENKALRNRLKHHEKEMVIGISNPIRKVYETIERVANTDAAVLIEGASGTGKELVARAIHEQSYRREKPFVIVNCAALPDTLLENELFGHEKEAFTGASTQRKGRFEHANEGTLFLDEITEMSLESQSGFLRVLEDGCFHRVGGSELIQVDVRVVSASNRNVQEEAEKGKFRYDLFYRLNVVPIQMPLLKDRQDDIPILVETFLREFSIKYNRQSIMIEPEVMQALLDYPWPGNIRELKNTIERAAILCQSDRITLQHCPVSIKNRQSDPTGNMQELKSGSSLRDMERVMIIRTLKEVDGHRRKAAEILGISVRALQYKIKDYHIQE
jgi:DNA-binding NtrC family response regulator